MSLYDENKKRTAGVYGHKFSYLLKVAPRKLFSFNAFQELKKDGEVYEVSSNRELFNVSQRQLDQDKSIKKIESGVFMKYTYKYKNQIFRIFSGYTNTQNKYEVTNSFNFPGYIPLDLKLQKEFIGLSTIKKEGLIQFKFQTEFRNSKIGTNSTSYSEFQFLPSAQFKLNFKPTHHAMLMYSKTLDFPSIEHLNTFNILSDFRNQVMPSQIFYSEIFSQNVYSLNYLNFNLYYGTVFLVNYSFTEANKAVTTNTARTNELNEMSFALAPSYESWNLNLSLEQRVTFLKSRFKIHANAIGIQSFNYLNGVENKTNTEVRTLKSSLLSNFNNPILNGEIGVFISDQQVNYRLIEQKNRILRTSILFNVSGILWDDFKYFINTAHENYRSAATYRSFLNLGMKIYYKQKMNKWKYWIAGDNILNVNNPESIEITSDHNVFSIDVIKRLSGYVGLGVSVDF